MYFIIREAELKCNMDIIITMLTSALVWWKEGSEGRNSNICNECVIEVSHEFDLMWHLLFI
jgi:hypothetical protein